MGLKLGDRQVEKAQSKVTVSKVLLGSHQAR